ncbi:hypothetical protein MVEN_00580600 [Mycena venus]|uniref:Uncharacterized protein n=1 Tax=Mycena venus TaxID=2733690 RepID=A0A8H6YJL2_9AGAR|nr:hypothetical protein MVEN_00580600 [Mycena venus]
MTSNSAAFDAIACHSAPPQFPPELEREIFETTAHLYSKTIPKLLRVARRVHSWIEPLLYYSVSIEPFENKRAKDYAIIRAVDTKPAGFLHNAVRHMYLCAIPWNIMGYRPESPWSAVELEKILRACRGVVSLVLVSDLDKPAVLPMLADMRPKRLYLISDLCHSQLVLTAPFFRNITHLLLADVNNVEESNVHGGWPLLRNLSRLPVLTHIAFDHLMAPHVLSTVLSECPHLKAMILYGTQPLKTPTEVFSIHDQRLVLFLSEDLIAQFVFITPDGQDIWARADVFISRKRRGDIEESSYHMEPVQISGPIQTPPVSDPVQAEIPVTPNNLRPLPKLAAKLERRIFLDVASLHPEMIPALLTVARCVLDWIEPRLYSELRISKHSRNTSAAIALLRAAESKPGAFLTNAVRSVELNAGPWNTSSKQFPWDSRASSSDDGWSDAELSRVLHRCTGVTNLALISDLSDTGLLAALAYMRPTCLTLAADTVTDQQMSHHKPTCLDGLPFCQNITHLHFFDADVNLFDPESSVLTNWSTYWSQQISRLPVLTHLAFPCQTPNIILVEVLSDLPSLDVLVLMADVFVDGKYISQHLPFCDPRVVVVKRNWQLERGGQYFWERVETFLAEKQKGKIEPSRCYLELKAPVVNH